MVCAFYICLNCLSDVFCEDEEGRVCCANCGDPQLVVLDFGDLSEDVEAASGDQFVLPAVLYAALAAAGVGKIVRGPADGKKLFDTFVKKFEEECRDHGFEEEEIDAAVAYSVRKAVQIAAEKGSSWHFALPLLV